MSNWCPTFESRLVDAVAQHIQGRLAYEAANCNLLAQAVSEAPEGDHVETGVLFGGSAIIAALVMQKEQTGGLVYAIDPLDGYYRGTRFGSLRDPVTDQLICRETVDANLRAFNTDARVCVVQQPSYPWPESLRDARFTSAYIDGDHWGDGPMHDWLEISSRCEVGALVVFDNCDSKHLAVEAAVMQAASSCGWMLEYRRGITAIVRRVA